MIVVKTALPLETVFPRNSQNLDPWKEPLLMVFSSFTGRLSR